jgi:uncharacterized membrane protein YfcA
MEWQQAVIIALIGMAAGLLGGLLGLGGAIIIIPALVMLLGFSQQLAQGTALLMLVLPTGALAAWQYYKAGNVDVKTALVLAATFLAGGFFGARFANQLPQELLRKLFAVLLIAISVKMLFFDKALK